MRPGSFFLDSAVDRPPARQRSLRRKLALKEVTRACRGGQAPQDGPCPRPRRSAVDGSIRRGVQGRATPHATWICPRRAARFRRTTTDEVRASAQPVPRAPPCAWPQAWSTPPAARAWRGGSSSCPLRAQWALMADAAASRPPSSTAPVKTIPRPAAPSPTPAPSSPHRGAQEAHRRPPCHRTSAGRRRVVGTCSRRPPTWSRRSPAMTARYLARLDEPLGTQYAVLVADASPQCRLLARTAAAWRRSSCAATPPGRLRRPRRGCIVRRVPAPATIWSTMASHTPSVGCRLRCGGTAFDQHGLYEETPPSPWGRACLSTRLQWYATTPWIRGSRRPAPRGTSRSWGQDRAPAALVNIPPSPPEPP